LNITATASIWLAPQRTEYGRRCKPTVIYIAARPPPLVPPSLCNLPHRRLFGKIPCRFHRHLHGTWPCPLTTRSLTASTVPTSSFVQFSTFLTQINQHNPPCETSQYSVLPSTRIRFICDCSHHESSCFLFFAT
jgi:hypothetical protein